MMVLHQHTLIGFQILRGAPNTVDDTWQFDPRSCMNNKQKAYKRDATLQQ